MVISARLGEAGLEYLDALLNKVQAKIVPFDEVQSRMAVQAWKPFGKGWHPAQLNLGDCCSYALASSLNDSLLFKGNDCLKSDIQA